MRRAAIRHSISLLCRLHADYPSLTSCVESGVKPDTSKYNAACLNVPSELETIGGVLQSAAPFLRCNQNYTRSGTRSMQRTAHRCSTHMKLQTPSVSLQSWPIGLDLKIAGTRHVIHFGLKMVLHLILIFALTGPIDNDAVAQGEDVDKSSASSTIGPDRYKIPTLK